MVMRLSKVKILGLPALVVLTLVFLAPTDAHAHTETPFDTQVADANEHPDTIDQSTLGHCHAEVSCTGSLHLVDLPRMPKPATPMQPGPNSRAPDVAEVALARDPPVPIQLL